MEASLKFYDYKIDYCNFKLNIDCNVDDIEINPDISYKIENIENNKYIVSLIYKLDNSENDNNLPFELSMKIDGLFEIENIKQINLIRQNAISILFPYLRSSISTLTMLANIPIYIIPPINIIDYLTASDNKGSQ